MPAIHPADIPFSIDDSQAKQMQPELAAAQWINDNKKRLSADYAKEEPVKPGYLSPDVELTNVLAVR